MTIETFEFKSCSRWDLAKKLFGVLWSRKMAVSIQCPPISGPGDREDDIKAKAPEEAHS